MRISIAAIVCVLSLVVLGMPRNPEPTREPPPRELGRVTWLRDLDRALETARAKKRDVFVLFQEVPG